jgi:hypothetical protein
MAKFEFKKATKKSAKGRLALIGPSGSGKTFWGLGIASRLGERIAVIDTEHGSASKYADVFNFDALELDSFSPATYVQAIEAAENAGYDVIVIDSLSHAWMGKDGALDQVDKAAERSLSGNSFAAWRKVTPMHNDLVDAMVGCRAHLIATMRTRTEYVLQENEKGKKEPKKIGLQPVQRDGLEYEFDVVCDIELEHNNLIVGKSRCPALRSRVFQADHSAPEDAGLQFGLVFGAWLTDGAEQVVSPVDEFLRRFRLAASIDDVRSIGAEIDAAKAGMNDPELQRLRRAAHAAKNRLEAEKGAA